MIIKTKTSKVIDLCVKNDALSVVKVQPTVITFELVRILTTDYTPSHHGFPYLLPFTLGE